MTDLFVDRKVELSLERHAQEGRAKDRIVGSEFARRQQPLDGVPTLSYGWHAMTPPISVAAGSRYLIDRYFLQRDSQLESQGLSIRLGLAHR